MLLLPRKKLGPTPKRNRMTHRPHGVKVEAEVVDGIQDLSQDLIGGVEVPQVSARIALADAAAAIGIQRSLISGIPGLLDGDPAFGSEQ